MLFNCTVSFNYTDTYAVLPAHDALAGCCPEQTHVYLSTAWCATKDVGALSQCLAERDAYLDGCALTGVKLRTSPNTLLASSGRRRRRVSSHLSSFVLGLMGLALLGVVSAAPTQQGATVECSRFVPAGNSQWNYERNTPLVRISETVDCTDSETPCALEPGEGGNWTAAFESANALDVTADMGALVKEIGPPYVGAIGAPLLKAALHLKPGSKGHLAAWAGALLVPGRYPACSDGKNYHGSAVLLDPSRFGLRIVLEPTLAQSSLQDPWAQNITSTPNTNSTGGRQDAAPGAPPPAPPAAGGIPA